MLFPPASMKYYYFGTPLGFLPSGQTDRHSTPEPLVSSHERAACGGYKTKIKHSFLRHITNTCSPFNSHGLTLILAWISNHLPGKV